MIQINAVKKLLAIRARQITIISMAFWLVVSQVVVVEKADAAITVRASLTSVQNSGTTLTITKPAGTVSGDVMIASIMVRTNVAVTPPAGWTAQVNTPNGANNVLITYSKVAGGSEPASYQWSWTGTLQASGGITSYIGVDNTTPVEAVGTGNTGSSVSVLANSVTSLTNNAVIVGSFGVSGQTSFIAPGGMTERFDVASTGGVTDVTVTQASLTQAVAGASGTYTATAAVSGNFAAHLIALKPSLPALEQSSYRFSVNADNNNPHFIQDNLSAGDDNIRGSVVDTISSVFYAVGDNGANWIIEKRRIADGSLCTASNCGTTFGINGRVTQDVAGSTSETAYAVVVDASLGYIYVVGSDTAADRWRIEKRDMLTGALISGFGTGGAVTANPSAGPDEALTIKLDNVNGYIYVGGYDGSGNNQWKIDKYRTDNGLICTAANCGTAFGTNGIYINNISNGDDRVSNLELDPTNTYLYISGFDAKNTRTQWTMYKVRADTAAVCTAAACGTQFGVNGLYNSDPTTRDDKVLTLQVDSAAGAIYLGGYESSSTTTNRWRIEKITLDTGTLITAFGNNGSCLSANSGAICASFSSGEDKIATMQLDGAGGFIYLIGVTDESGTDSQWRVQKRNRSDGSLVTAWATSGTASFNPSANKDPANSIALDTDRGVLYAMGGDRSLGTTNMQWRFEELSLDTGTKWLAPANTLGGISSTVTFRLRLLLHVSSVPLDTADALQYKLQYSPKVGTCDTGFVGESYGDLLTTGGNDILFHTNPSVTDGTNAVTQTGEDPAHGADTVITQTIEQANSFTNSTANVLVNQDGMWDFVMKDNGAFGAYCFRVVDSNGGTLASYTQIPELTFCKDDPKTNALLRHGTYFCEGLKKSFFWVD